MDQKAPERTYPETWKRPENTTPSAPICPLGRSRENVSTMSRLSPTYPSLSKLIQNPTSLAYKKMYRQRENEYSKPCNACSHVAERSNKVPL